MSDQDGWETYRNTFYGLRPATRWERFLRFVLFWRRSS